MINSNKKKLESLFLTWLFEQVIKIPFSFKYHFKLVFKKSLLPETNIRLSTLIKKKKKSRLGYRHAQDEI